LPSSSDLNAMCPAGERRPMRYNKQVELYLDSRLPIISFANWLRFSVTLALLICAVLIVTCAMAC
jgi:hypothetical protein